MSATTVDLSTGCGPFERRNGYFGWTLADLLTDPRRWTQIEMRPLGSAFIVRA
jgi:hypothetical protein